MALERLEQQWIGQTLEPLDRLVAGLIAITGALAHALLGVAALVFLYLLIFVA